MPSSSKNRFATGCTRFAKPSCQLLNREFQPPPDGWFQIVPLGEFRNTAQIDGKEQVIVQILDRAAIDALANGFSGEILIDYEHFAHDPEKETRAAGWITAVQPRDDGLYAQIRLSNSGRADMEGGDYRFISPEFDQVSPVNGNRWRPVHLSGAAFTNKPNLTTLKPLSNREAGSGNQTTNTNIMDYKTTLLKVLGLPNTATDEEIQAAADKLGETTAPEMANEVEALNRDLNTARATIADADLVNLKLDDETKATVREALIENRAKGLKIVEALRKGQAQDAQPGKTTLFNRATAKPPKTGETLVGENKAEEARAAKIYNRASAIAAAERVPWGIAFSRAEAEASDA